MNRLKAGAGRRLTAGAPDEGGRTRKVWLARSLPTTCMSLRPHWWVETDNCFKRLRILNAFEIALWQTGSTSKRADVILDLSATTTAESKQAAHATWQENRRRPRRLTTFVRDFARIEISARVGNVS